MKKFVHDVALQRGLLSDSAANTTGGNIFTFGSYRLGVHGPGSDIDALCVVPMHVSREDFFEVFAPMLRELESVTEVLVCRSFSYLFMRLTSEWQDIPAAFVPIIKIKISGISIDLLMARVALPSIPDNLPLENDNILLGIDERCVRGLGGSFNCPKIMYGCLFSSLGPRVAGAILRLVPNEQVFQYSLRCIRLWAQRQWLSIFSCLPDSCRLRTSHLFQREGFLWRCCLGCACSPNLSTLSKCYRWYRYQQVLYYHAPVVC